MSATGEVRVPKYGDVIDAFPIDCEEVTIDGVVKKRQRVTAESQDVTDAHHMLGKILKELRVMNRHLASMTNEKFTMNDLGD